MLAHSRLEDIKNLDLVLRGFAAFRRLVPGAHVLHVVGEGRAAGRLRAVDAELEVHPDSMVRALPSRVHSIIVVTSVRKPVVRALTYARASRPSSLEAVVVDVDPDVAEDGLTVTTERGGSAASRDMGDDDIVDAEIVDE